MKSELPDEVIDAMLKSRPARGAWVEIHAPPSKFEALAVAPRKGRVG